MPSARCKALCCFSPWFTPTENRARSKSCESFPLAAQPVTKENFMLKQFSEQELLGKPRSPEQEAEILALQTMGDDTIDFSDIPEIRAIPPGAVRGRFYSTEIGRAH